MTREEAWNNKELVETLSSRGVAVMPTDTIYGVCGRALSESSVRRIYDLKERTPNKPFIILISSVDDIKKFGIDLSEEQSNILKSIWQETVSIVLSCSIPELAYLHRGTNTLAFRLPKESSLLSFLEKTGPLVAPSANKEGFPPAETVNEARKYFGDEVDFYASGGKIKGKPSKVIRLNEDNSQSILRD